MGEQYKCIREGIAGIPVGIVVDLDTILAVTPDDLPEYFEKVKSNGEVVVEWIKERVDFAYEAGEKSIVTFLATRILDLCPDFAQRVQGED